MAKYPLNAKVFQLLAGSKEPANSAGHLSSEDAGVFIATNKNTALVLGDSVISQFTVLDIDYPENAGAKRLIEEAKKTNTRTVITPHGVQYIWASPQGMPRIRTNLKGAEGIFGQLLTHGYVVAPESEVRCDGVKHPDGKSCGVRTYKLLRDVEPAPCPPWVVALAEELSAKKHEVGTQECAGVPRGSHDKFGANLTYNLHRWGGLSSEAIMRFYAEGGLKAFTSTLEDYDEAAPFTLKDAERWTNAVVKKTQTEASYLPNIQSVSEDDETECLGTATFIEAPLRWFVRGYVPWGFLVSVYGKGGTGKSTFGSWLAKESTLRAVNFLGFCVEESPKLFSARAILGGADRNRMYMVKNAAEWLFPRDTQKLADLIDKLEIKFIWLDSLYSHFQQVEGSNVSERARQILGPLSMLAREKDCTIMGVFHENKSGAFLGATEMENVVRVLLKASRRNTSKSPLTIKVAKTNMPFRPDTYLRFEVDRPIMADPETGEVQMEEIEPGKLEPLRIPIARRIKDGLIEEEALNDTIEAAEKLSDRMKEM